MGVAADIPDGLQRHGLALAGQAGLGTGEDRQRQGVRSPGETQIPLMRSDKLRANTGGGRFPLIPLLMSLGEGITREKSHMSGFIC